MLSPTEGFQVFLYSLSVWYTSLQDSAAVFAHVLYNYNITPSPSFPGCRTCTTQQEILYTDINFGMGSHTTFIYWVSAHLDWRAGKGTQELSPAYYELQRHFNNTGVPLSDQNITTLVG